MKKCIVYTRHADRGVTICRPTDWVIKWLGCGGFWGSRPRGWYDAQIERQIARGVRPDAARRYVRAMISGGCTTAEALEIIRDRDCAHMGEGIELWDEADVPADRWFRDAWARSHNGGPITIDLKKARQIQWQRIHAAAQADRERRSQDIDMDAPIDLDEVKIKGSIRLARDVDDVRAIWPRNLPMIGGSIHA